MNNINLKWFIWKRFLAKATLMKHNLLYGSRKGWYGTTWTTYETDNFDALQHKSGDYVFKVYKCATSCQTKLFHVICQGAYQPAHPRSLIINTFVVCYLDSMIPIDAIPQISRLQLQYGFCSWAGQFDSYWLQTPKDRFSHDVAQMLMSHLMRKPVYAICEQRRRSALTSVQSDQHLCCSLSR